MSKKRERVIFEAIFFAACLIISSLYMPKLLLIVIILIVIYILLKDVYIKLEENNRLLGQLLEQNTNKDKKTN